MARAQLYQFSSDVLTIGDAPLSAVILALLTAKVRVATDMQFTLFPRPVPPSSQQVRNTLKRLEVKQLVKRFVVMVHPLLTLTKPVCTWAPGKKAPNAERVSWRLRSRWTQPPVRTSAVTATPLGKKVRGDAIGKRPVRQRELCHDLHVTQLFLNLFTENPDQARLWVHEDALDSGHYRGAKIPDAMVAEKAIDFGGSYNAAKVRMIHRAHAATGTPYEIW